ncbi:VanZ family protein [Halomonas alkalisoli]|uniref:VanZ family protein n=1 Tax=Halomonas alkalisoli TaxID=2907158 RepID=UPI001F2A5509|nr:VanZ family protein [Halomonas alkalisoli]MCE9682261.1 VanZ family protein [Halomonas alkalisoli]
MPDRSTLQAWHDRHRLWAVLAILAAIVIAIGSLTPGSEMPKTLPWDKFNHFVGYAGLAGLVGLAGLPLVRTFVFVVLFGICIEYLQIPVPGRSGGDWWDILANSLGAATAVLVLHGLRRWVIRPPS